MIHGVRHNRAISAFNHAVVQRLSKDSLSEPAPTREPVVRLPRVVPPLLPPMRRAGPL